MSTLAAPAFAAAAVDREVIATIPVGDRRLVVVAGVPVSAGSVAAGSTLGSEEVAATAVPEGGARIVAVGGTAGLEWRPTGDRRLSAGDELGVVAPQRSLAVSVARAGSRADDPTVHGPTDVPRPRDATIGSEPVARHFPAQIADAAWLLVRNRSWRRYPALRHAAADTTDRG